MNTDEHIRQLLIELNKPKNRREESAKERTVKNSSVGNYRGRPIWTCDAETDPFKKGRVPKPFIWGIYTGEEYHQFETTEEVVEFVQEEEVILYAHNGGKFDWHFLTNFIGDFEPLTIIAGRLAKFRIGLCEFRDSYNIIPAPLSAYKKDDISYDIFEIAERHKPHNWRKICEYLKSDCIYLHEMITAFVAEYGMNLTQAGSAMKVWSKTSGIKKPQSSPMYYAEMSRYYYGGRVECFEKGIIEDEFEVIDINSAYPRAMIEEHPWGLNYSTFDEMPKEISDEELARCFISLDAASLGAFPARGDNGLSFPADGEIREFHVTGWEYLAARDTGCLRNHHVKEVRQYFETVNFRDYVEHFYRMKDEAKAANDAARYLFAKLFLNSLYGKFASNPENYQEFMTVPASMIDGAVEDGWYYCKLLCEETAVVNKPLEEEKRRYYDVAVAASITGFVRAYLFRHIKMCRGVIYCDTDSIAARSTNGVPLSSILGEWSLEAKCDYGAVAGKKLYAFHRKDGTYNISKEKEWKTASKGVKLEPKEIIDIASGKSVVYEPEAPTFSVKRGVIFTPRKIEMTA